MTCTCSLSQYVVVSNLSKRTTTLNSAIRIPTISSNSNACRSNTIATRVFLCSDRSCVYVVCCGALCLSAISERTDAQVKGRSLLRTDAMSSFVPPPPHNSPSLFQTKQRWRQLKVNPSHARPWWLAGRSSL